MLPGIRFLLAAIVLSMSILMFGLGAAALLRAAHEEFASMPARRTLPEPVFAQQTETPAPTLALLRVEPVLAERTPDELPAAMQALEPAPEAVPVPAVETEKLAVLALDDEAAPAETAKPETVANEAPAAAADTVAPAAPAETKLAAVEAAPAPVPEAAPSAPAPIAAPAAAETNTVATRLVALASPAAVVMEPAAATQPGAKPDDSELKKKRAERAKERRRLAARRAKLAAQQAAAALAAQQAANPFAPIVQPAHPAATTERRH
jgi:hypothetical protein